MATPARSTFPWRPAPPVAAHRLPTDPIGASYFGPCRTTRPISWISAARKDFDSFPGGAQAICLTALTIAAQGSKADIAKPLKHLGSGVMEIALPDRGNAFRVVYAVQTCSELWVVHAFAKKSTQGIKTPKREIDLIVAWVKRLKEMLR